MINHHFPIQMPSNDQTHGEYQFWTDPGFLNAMFFSAVDSSGEHIGGHTETRPEFDHPGAGFPQRIP